MKTCIYRKGFSIRSGIIILGAVLGIAGAGTWVYLESKTNKGRSQNTAELDAAVDIQKNPERRLVKLLNDAAKDRMILSELLIKLYRSKARWEKEKTEASLEVSRFTREIEEAEKDYTKARFQNQWPVLSGGVKHTEESLIQLTRYKIDRKNKNVDRVLECQTKISKSETAIDRSKIQLEVLNDEETDLKRNSGDFLVNKNMKNLAAIEEKLGNRANLAEIIKLADQLDTNTHTLPLPQEGTAYDGVTGVSREMALEVLQGKRKTNASKQP